MAVKAHIGPTLLKEKYENADEQGGAGAPLGRYMPTSFR